MQVFALFSSFLGGGGGVDVFILAQTSDVAFDIKLPSFSMANLELC
jgi:hypothetical protein